MAGPVTKLNNIQVLRAFAAVVVVLFHTGYAFPHMLPFGSFGVDVFFVISGYIMARIIDPDSDSNSSFFFRRRVIRIVPPYWFFTILLFLVSLRLPQLMGSTRATTGDLLMSLFFLPFTKGSGLIQPLLFIGWSLNYEMFFYLALSLGILIHTHLLPRVKAILIGAVLVVATMIVSLFFAKTSTAAAFYSRDVMLEFILGIVAYYIYKAVSDSRARTLRIPSLLVCLGSAATLIMIQGVVNYHGPNIAIARLLILGLPSFLLIVSTSLLSKSGWDTSLSSLVLIGDASYILYLIHPYCEYGMSRMLAHRFTWMDIKTPVGAFLSVSLSVALAVLIHIYAERPTVKFLNRRFGGIPYTPVTMKLPAA
jgi:exopolysaccharide production protein ExoZ